MFGCVGRRVVTWGAVVLLVLTAGEARGEAEPGLSALYHRVAADVSAGRPLVVTVHVALCDNSQIRCGGRGLGNGDDPRRNLYWGGGAGLRAVFDRARGWRRVHLDGGDGERVLERVVWSGR